MEVVFKDHTCFPLNRNITTEVMWRRITGFINFKKISLFNLISSETCILDWPRGSSFPVIRLRNDDLVVTEIRGEFCGRLKLFFFSCPYSMACRKLMKKIAPPLFSLLQLHTYCLLNEIVVSVPWSKISVPDGTFFFSLYFTSLINKIIMCIRRKAEVNRGLSSGEFDLWRREPNSRFSHPSATTLSTWPPPVMYLLRDLHTVIFFHTCAHNSFFRPIGCLHFYTYLAIDVKLGRGSLFTSILDEEILLHEGLIR